MLVNNPQQYNCGHEKLFFVKPTESPENYRQSLIINFSNLGALVINRGRVGSLN
jgi:hypothetical protein